MHERHYGMDWLRIGAFGLLILYHVGMVFVPWGYHVKAEHVARWAEFPMLATNAWRMPLLFAVSGFATAMLLARQDGRIGRFLAGRAPRLLLPLVFGMAVIVPPHGPTFMRRSSLPVRASRNTIPSAPVRGWPSLSSSRLRPTMT